MEPMWMPKLALLHWQSRGETPLTISYEWRGVTKYRFQCLWPRVQHLSCGSDGVRVSSKDVYYFCFEGMVDDL